MNGTTYVLTPADVLTIRVSRVTSLLLEVLGEETELIESLETETFEELRETIRNLRRANEMLREELEEYREHAPPPGWWTYRRRSW